MDNQNPNMPASNNNGEPDIRSTRDFPNEADVYSRRGRQQLFDTTHCRVKAYVEGVAECLTPQFCNYCGSSIPFAYTNFCTHPLLVKRVTDQ